MCFVKEVEIQRPPDTRNVGSGDEDEKEMRDLKVSQMSSDVGRAESLEEGGP